MFSWRHFEISSDLLFSSSSGLELIIISFSVVQRSHLFVMLLYGLALQMIVHLILKSFLLSCSCQMYLDSSGLFMWLLWRNECLCCVNLCLNVPSVNPNVVLRGIVCCDSGVVDYT